MWVRSSATSSHRLFTPASSHLPVSFTPTCSHLPAGARADPRRHRGGRGGSGGQRRRRRRVLGRLAGPGGPWLFFPVSRCNEVLCVGDQAPLWTAPSPPSHLSRRREARPSRREGSPSSSTPRTWPSCRRRCSRPRCSRQAALIGHLEPSMRSSSAGVAAVTAVGAAAAVAAPARRHRRASAVSGCLSATTRLIRLRG